MTARGRSLFTIPGFTDPFSSLSHLLAAGVFAALAVPLVRKGMRARKDTEPAWNARVISLAIFAISAVVLLSTSGVFHLLGLGGTPRLVLQRLDHAAIFLLIAGTFTPIHTIMFRGLLRWAPLLVVWTFAVLGVAIKSVYFAQTPPSVGLSLYLGMGWVGVVPMYALWRRHGERFVRPLLLGGVAYTVGAIADGVELRPLIEGVIRAHEVFHIAVIAGLSLHWRFVWTLADLGPDGPNPD